MLIQNLNQYFCKKKPRGVIHIGAHKGEEKKWYIQNGFDKIVWIEANPNYEKYLRTTHPEDTVIICGVGSEIDVKPLNIANNGESSSFLEMDLHMRHHPGIVFTQSINVEVKPMSLIISEHNLDITDFNFLNIDVQGFELEVLKGFNTTLNSFDYIYTEINSNFLYKENPLVSDIDKFLSSFNFKRAETRMTQWEWGDAMYVKND